jgi:regulator of RNase E activity RraB
MPQQFDFPNDGDGDALRRIVADGSDLTKPMLVDFQIAAPDETTAKTIGMACHELGYRVRASADSGRTTWTVNCATRMVLNYDAVCAVQDELHAIAKAHGGKSDGWGTFGNAPRPR